MLENSMAIGHWLPVAFGILLTISVFLYMVLDGYDLGVGLLLPFADNLDRQSNMIASMGPYWDANETWLVLSVGIILIAFPEAQGIVLGALYAPIFCQLFGVIMRGVAYEFRNNCLDQHVVWWHRVFFTGSLVMSLSQGYIVGIFLAGLEYTLFSNMLAAIISVILTLTYALNGASWMMIKSGGKLYVLAVSMAKIALRLVLLSMLILVAWIFYKFRMENLLIYISLFFAFLVLYVIQELLLKKNRFADGNNWDLFIMVSLFLVIYIVTIAYTCFPYIVPYRMTVWQAAASHDSLYIIFIAAMIILPIILAYTVLLHRVFKGKISKLSYD